MSLAFPDPQPVRRFLPHLLAIEIIAALCAANGQNVTPSPSLPKQAPAAQMQSAESTQSGLGAEPIPDPPPSAPGAASGQMPLPSTSQRDPYLSELGTIFGASQQALELHLCFAGVQDLSDSQVAQGAVLAEALALRAGYRPLLVSYGPELEPEKFNVLIGTVDQLRTLIPEQDTKHISKGYISIQRVRSNRSGFYLFIAGRTSEDLASAVLQLGFARERLPQSSAAFIPAVSPPVPPQFVRAEPLEAGSTLTFGRMEEQGATIEPLANGELALNLFFPGYFRTDSDAQITINLHLGTTGPAVLHLNGREISIRPSSLSPPEKVGSEYSTAIPVRMFQHGRNILTIAAEGFSHSGAAGDRLQLLTDSELVIHNLDKYPKLPDLQIVSQTFYPFIGQPDGSDLAILLPERDSETIEAAWTLLSRLAQSANTFFYAAQLTFHDYDSRRHVLVVGTYSHLLPAFRRIAALRAFNRSNLHIPLADLNTISPGTNLKQLIAHLLGQDSDSTWVFDGNPQDNQLSQAGIAVPDYAIIATAKIPAAGPGWNLVVTAFSQENLLRRVQSLVQPAFWDQIRGDIDRWKESPTSFQAHVADAAEETGAIAVVELPLGERLDLRIWIGVIAGMIIVYVIVTARILGKFDRTSRLRPRPPK